MFFSPWSGGLFFEEVKHCDRTWDLFLLQATCQLFFFLFLVATRQPLFCVYLGPGLIVEINIEPTYVLSGTTNGV